MKSNQGAPRRNILWILFACIIIIFRLSNLQHGFGGGVVTTKECDGQKSLSIETTSKPVTPLGDKRGAHFGTNRPYHFIQKNNDENPICLSPDLFLLTIESESTSARTDGNENSCDTGKYCEYNHESSTSAVMGAKYDGTCYSKGEEFLCAL